MKDPQQASLLELCQKGIGVYSPHTSVDGAEGGVNDFLVDVVSSIDIQGLYVEESKPIIPLKTPVPGTCHYRWRDLEVDHTMGGYGRIVKLTRKVPFNDILRKLKVELGLKYSTLFSTLA